MRKARKEITIEETFFYRIYKIGKDFFVDYYGNAPIVWSYGSLEAAKEAIYYHFN